MAAAHLTVSVGLLVLAGLGDGSPPRKAKRGFDLGHVFLHSDLDLFHSGMHLATHYPSLGFFAGDHFFNQDHQHLDFFPPAQGSVHQYQPDIPTAIPGNPKKPVYHYTPLPKGTFPAPKIDEDAINTFSQKRAFKFLICSYMTNASRNVVSHLVKTEIVEWLYILPLDNETFSYEKQQNSQDSNSANVLENPSYLFGYRISDDQQALHMGRKEKMDGSVLQGVYHVLLPDNRMQIVHYWSDLTGYHPTITYA